MVKKSTKSRPKRVTLGEKYMRIRKAKQKLAKDKRKAKKESKQRALQGGRKPPRKDPGVPASWPFREEFLKEMAFEKARILDKKKKAKMERYAQKKVGGPISNLRAIVFDGWMYKILMGILLPAAFGGRG